MFVPEVIDFDQIKREVPLSEVLSRYTRVPNKERYRIPCPLHSGERYNFSVDETRGLFHCFTCGIGGDVVVLLAKLEGISNIEAGKRLTAEYGVQASGLTRDFNAAWNEVKKWEPHLPLPIVELPPSQPLNGYRRFSREAIRHFDLRLVSSGVLIPFRDERGRVVGYAIRQINREPKYLNSTNLRKSDIVYGLYENLGYIIDAGTAIVCEGQFSAVRVWDTGYKNVTATLGASMSPSQAHILGQHTGRLTILYDSDEAGRNGAAKTKEMYSSIFHIDIKNLPEGHDPDVADLSSILT